MAIQPTPPQSPSSRSESPGQEQQEGQQAHPSLTWQEAGIPSEHPVIVWMQQNMKLLGAAVGGVLLLVAGWSGFSWMQEQARQEANEALGAILLSTNGTEQVEALEGLLASAPGPVDNAVRLALAKMYMELQDYGQAAKMWEQIANSAEPPMDITAGMGHAETLAVLGQAKEALQVIAGLKADAPENFTVALLRLEAQVAEMAGEYQQAIAAYAAMLEANPEQPSAFFRYKMAELEKRQQADSSS